MTLPPDTGPRATEAAELVELATNYARTAGGDGSGPPPELNLLFLSWLAFETTRVPPSREALRDALLVLRGQARYGDTGELWVR